MPRRACSSRRAAGSPRLLHLGALIRLPRLPRLLPEQNNYRSREQTGFVPFPCLAKARFACSSPTEEWGSRFGAKGIAGETDVGGARGSTPCGYESTVRYLATPHKGSRVSRGIALRTKSGDAEIAVTSKSQPDGGGVDGGVVVPRAGMRVQSVVANANAFITSVDSLAAQPPTKKAEPMRSELAARSLTVSTV